MSALPTTATTATPLASADALDHAANHNATNTLVNAHDAAITALQANTTVIPGSYTNTNLTVNANGRITAASSGVGGGGSGTVTSVTATDATIVVSGTPTVAPTLGVGVIPESKVTNLVADLASKMATATYDPAGIASQVMGLAGTQTVTGAKTFSSALTLNGVKAIFQHDGTSLRDYSVISSHINFQDQLIFSDQSGGSAMYWFDTTSGAATITLAEAGVSQMALSAGGGLATISGGQNNDFAFLTDGGANQVMTIRHFFKRVGINQNFPSFDLDVNGTTNTTSVITANLQVTGGTPGTGKVLTSDTTGNATWQTPAGGGSGISSATANGAVYATAATTATSTAALTNGQLLVGSTGAAPVAAALTAGANIAVTNGAGSITVAVTGTVPSATTATSANNVTGVVAIANGGTGVATLPTGILKGAGTGAITAVTAPTGAVVGTTDTQVLTNKAVTKRVVAVTDGATVTLNWDTTDVATCTFAGNRTIAFSGATPTDGQMMMFIVKQDATGSRTIAWPASVRFGTDITATTLTTTAAKKDRILLQYDATDAKYDVISFVKGF